MQPVVYVRAGEGAGKAASKLGRVPVPSLAEQLSACAGGDGNTPRAPDVASHGADLEG